MAHVNFTPDQQLVVPEREGWELEHASWRAQWNLPYFKRLPGDLVDEKLTEETDSAAAASNRWDPAPRETEADRTGDVKSLRRRLDQRIFLLVKRKGDNAWSLPTAENEEVGRRNRRETRACKLPLAWPCGDDSGT